MTRQQQEALYQHAAKINSFNERFKATPKSTLIATAKKNATRPPDEQIYEEWAHRVKGIDTKYILLATACQLCGPVHHCRRWAGKNTRMPLHSNNSHSSACFTTLFLEPVPPRASSRQWATTHIHKHTSMQEKKKKERGGGEGTRRINRERRREDSETMPRTRSHNFLREMSQEINTTTFQKKKKKMATGEKTNNGLFCTVSRS